MIQILQRLSIIESLNINETRLGKIKINYIDRKTILLRILDGDIVYQKVINNRYCNIFYYILI
jgi:hypothetical protein